MAWQLSGELIEACSCKAACPCVLGPAEPDQGWCSGALTFAIDKGKSDGVDLSGRAVLWLIDLPKDFASGDGTVRVTPDQDLMFRWVTIADVRELYRRLAAAGLGLAEASTIANVASCPGAESCRLAVTQSRGLGRLLEDYLRSKPELIAAADGARIKISGCPNGCGQHHIATIGFQGSVRRLGARAVPQYFVMVGGGADGETAAFGRVAAKIPARRAPEAVERIVALYRTERRDHERLADFLRRTDVGVVKRTLADLEGLSEDDASPDDFVDLGEDHAFQPEVLDGECSA